MAERYSRLYALPENQYTAGAPVLIAAGALLKDNQTGKALAQIKFRSISEKQIKAVKISVAAFDVSGKELEGVAEYQYLDLNMGRNTEFGQKQAVTLPNAVTRSFVAKCTDVFFADGSAWSADSDAAWKSLPAQATVAEKLGNLAAQYQRDTSTGSKFVPVEHDDLWFCSCGALNHNEEAKCHNCKQEKEKLLAALDLEALDQRNEEYKAAEAEKAAKQAEADRIQRAKIKKFATLTVTVAAISVAVIMAVFLLVTNVIIPNSNYNKAIKLMEAGQYTEAIAAFEAMDGYKDSIHRIEECHLGILDGEYNDAIALMEAGKYEEAIAEFSALDDYRDSRKQVEEARKLRNQNICALIEEGNYTGAWSEYKSLSYRTVSPLTEADFVADATINGLFSEDVDIITVFQKQNVGWMWFHYDPAVDTSMEGVFESARGIHIGDHKIEVLLAYGNGGEGEMRTRSRFYKDIDPSLQSKVLAECDTYVYYPCGVYKLYFYFDSYDRVSFVVFSCNTNIN